MQSIKQYRGLSKEIYVLFLATIVNRMGDFVYPFLTLFLKSRLGLNSAQIGNVMVWSTVLYIIAIAIGGKLADHFNRKRLYMGATAISIILIIVCGFMKESFEMVYLLILSGIFLRMAVPAMDAIKMDVTRPENRQASFSLIYLGMNIGVAFGQLIAGILFAHHTKLLFFGDALTSIMALTLIGVAINDEKGKGVYRQVQAAAKTAPVKEDPSLSRLEQAQSGSLFSVLMKRPGLLCFCGICSVLSFMYAQSSFMLPLQLEKLYEVEKGSYYFGRLMSLNAIIVVVLTPSILVWTKKNKAMVNIGLGAIGYTLGFGLFGFWTQPAGFVLGTILWTLGEILCSTNTGVYLANHSPVSHRARFQATYGILKSVGRTLSPLLMGQFLMQYSERQGWRVIGTIGIVMVIIIFMSAFREKEDVKENHQKAA